jgi:SNF2 family DNA or RNA helicase
MTLKTSLMPYQTAAVEKLIGIRVGALYMEMGTGKTRTALEMIARRLAAGKIDRVLWLCPCSIRRNIAVDIAKHADGINIDRFQIYGIESLSGSARLYAQLLAYVQAGACMLVVDESNLVKNSSAIRSQRVTAIAQKCPYRIILNGTPISKNEADLYGQWYLLDWRILGYQSFWSFAANHLEYDEKYKGRVRRVLHVDYLTDKIAPYSYMVKKSDCLTLPEKNYRRAYFELTRKQEEEYERVKEMFLISLLSDEERIGSAAIYRTFTALQEVTSGRRILTPPDASIKHEPFFRNPRNNPRIDALLGVIFRMSGQIVIWCKFAHEISDVAAVLTEDYGADNVTEFHGALSQSVRNANLEKFQAGARFFVANKACAGYGLNLQFCSQAIYYNNDWDWATRAQSEDRLHRIGQEADVDILDICADSKIDERILACLNRKESLADWFRRELKSKNAFEWVDGKDDVYDTNRVQGRAEAANHS